MLAWAILFGSTWARFETRFSGILERLAYHSDLLDREAYAINISEILRHSGDQARRWEQEDAELDASKYHTVLSWLKMNEPSQDYIFRKHCDGSISDSSDWFLNQDKMQRWKSDCSENALVWITGKPGAGMSRSKPSTPDTYHHTQANQFSARISFEAFGILDPRCCIISAATWVIPLIDAHGFFAPWHVRLLRSGKILPCMSTTHTT